MAASTDDDRPESFEAALERLAHLVAGLESGSLGLSESIAAYERGVGILKRLHEELATAEERVKVLVRIDEEGRPVLDDAAPAADAGPAAESSQTTTPRPARAARTKALRSRQLPGMDEAEPA
jgi:exodeoxyribonuclease VII small subunit